MKSKCFNYVVQSAGRSVKGHFISKVLVDVERMTQLAAWIAQKAACEERWEFDPWNFSVAVQPFRRVKK
jgi:hypothetical protein